jgi:transposase
LVKVQRDLENQVRGLLKSAGLIVGRAKDGVFSARTKQLLAAHIDLATIALPLLEAREAIHQQLVQLERRVRQLAKEHRQTSAFMTAPGVGPQCYSKDVNGNPSWSVREASLPARPQAVRRAGRRFSV